ncbi:phosphatase PAP2 family protein [Tabrizicola sp.]|uniref:phosphatase PAP2 family protein n=1 Tax=Tabrizicola sp. TaxID=2005166 RepID=UPI003F32DA90
MTSETEVFPARRLSIFRLLPTERLLLQVIGFFAVVAFGLVTGLQRDINWPPFLAGFVGTLGFVAIGAYVRQVKAAPRIGLALVGLGLFTGFTAVSTICIFALFPLPNPLIDEWLISLDGQLGYHWPGFVAGLAEYPVAAKALGYLYHTSLPQILLLIVILAALSREVALHRFLVVGVLTLVITVSIWWIWPSVGPSGFQKIPEEVRLATGLYFNDQYGAYLRWLVEIGPPRISPEVMTGVVAFPSYHMIMACMVAWFSRHTPVFIPALLASTAMVPATLSHGGHHLVDLLAGIVVFALSVLIANRIVPDRDSRSG